MALPLLPDLVMARQHASVTFYAAEGPVRLEQPQLLEQLAAVRQQLRGCAPGSVVAIAAPTSARVFIAILAAWAEGLAVSLLPHELGSGSGRLDARRFNAMLEALDAGLVLVEADLLEHVAAEWRERTRLIDSLELTPQPEPPQPSRAHGLARHVVQPAYGMAEALVQRLAREHGFALAGLRSSDRAMAPHTWQRYAAQFAMAAGEMA